MLQDEGHQPEDEIVAEEVAEEQQEPMPEAGPLGDAQDLWGDFGLEADGEDLGNPALGGDAGGVEDAAGADLGAPAVRAPHADRAVAGENARDVVVDGETFVFTDLFDNAQGVRQWKGISLACSTCGITRDLHFIRSGMSVQDAAERLVAWRAACPGRHQSKKHRELGNQKHAGRLMCNYRKY